MATKVRLVRVGTHDPDYGTFEDGILDLAEEALAEHGGLVPMDRSYVRHRLRIAASHKSPHRISEEDPDGRDPLIWSAMVDGALVAALILALFPENHNPQFKYLTNEHLFVRSDFRSGPLSSHMIQAMMAYADETGLTLKPSLTWGEDVDLKDRWMQIKGFTYTGGNFIYKP